MAAKKGVCLARDLGIRTVILEGDEKRVLDSFGDGSEDLSHNEIILVEAYSIASSFNLFKAQFIPRYCNIVVDRLVDLNKVRDKEVWTIEAPHYIWDVLVLEAGF